jgi:hypothetical protein
MLTTFPHELVQAVNAAVDATEAVRHATAAKVERLSEVPYNLRLWRLASIFHSVAMAYVT